MVKFYIVVEASDLDLESEALSVTYMNHTRFKYLEDAKAEKIRKDEDLATECHVLEITIIAKQIE
jgi:hypothetical protein